MIPALTLEPLSWDDLPEAAVLWADPAVIRWTNIAAPCTEAGAADRLEHLLDCQRGLPFSTVFALREGTAFRGLAGCPPVDTAAGIYGLFYQLLPACWGRGLGLAPGPRCGGGARCRRCCSLATMKTYGGGGGRRPWLSPGRTARTYGKGLISQKRTGSF